MVNAKLSEAFNSLQPIDYSFVPHDNEQLSDFLKTAFSHAELLVNSIPPLPAASSSSSSDKSDISTKPNSARKAIETFNPSPPPNSVDEAHSEFHKQWGKPLKLSAKENPLGVAVFKGAAHDRHGAWFARRSTHRGIGFEKFKRAIQREFFESIKVHGVGAGAVRGMGADVRIEKLEAKDVGKAEVWQLSAVFPGPVTPREFVTLLLSSEHALGPDSTAEGLEAPPRHYIMISRPTKHVDLPNRKDLVKGTYESVEMIRELPSQPGSKEQDPELNPVEWVMITRSDPGGGIPKFMVERGTPGTVVADTLKFLDWATQLDDSALAENEERNLEEVTEKTRKMSLQATSGIDGQSTPNGTDATAVSAEQPATAAQKQPQKQQHSSQGLISSIFTNVEATVESYLPKGFHMPGSWHSNEPDDQPAHHHFDQIDSPDDDEDTESDNSDSSEADLSLDYFESAKETRSGGGIQLEVPPNVSSDRISGVSTPASSVLEAKHGRQASQHDRELLKISHKRAQLDEKIAKEREAVEKKARESSEKEQKEADKARERQERHLQKQEKKYQREMEKLEARREREERRAEEGKRKAERQEEKRKKKAIDRDTLRATQVERDGLSEKLKVSERECEVLRAQLERVQRENTILVAQMGEEQVKQALEEFEGKVKDAARSSSLSFVSGSSSAAARASSEGRRSGSTTSDKVTNITTTNSSSTAH